ncbi:MAG: YgaP family membrane protein [Brevirhabdus sp.]
MTLDRTVMAFAGVMTLISVALTAFVSPLWMWFTVFIGANMIQSAFTGFCPAAMIFKKLGIKPGNAF